MIKTEKIDVSILSILMIKSLKCVLLSALGLWISVFIYLYDGYAKYNRFLFKHVYVFWDKTEK